MTDLPRDLAPWRPLLDLFPADLAAALGAWIPRLALAIGPMRTARPEGTGDPDGFADLARRGSYERLLLTEWLLADELPDEFLRRAANGEHAFFQLARRAPARARSSVALFDAGPDQLGAPRLAHLAALIVLAARADRAGARFAWGLLHQPDRPLFTEVTPQSVRSLLAARTAVPPTEDDVATFADLARRGGWDDAWIVGAGAAVPGWKHATLSVRDVLDPARRALALTARAPAAPPREVELDLPPDPVAARLIRDPFAVAAPAPTPIPTRSVGAPISNLVFAANGTKVFARTASGEIVAYPVPNSPHAAVGQPKRYRPRRGGVVVAVGWVARGVVMLTIKDDAVVLEHTNRSASDLFQRRIPIPAGLAIAAPQPADPLSPLVYLGEASSIYFTDARRALYCIRYTWLGDLHQRARVASLARVVEEVSALAHGITHVVFVGRGLEASTLSAKPDSIRSTFQGKLGGWCILTEDGRPEVPGYGQPLDGDGTFEAHFGRAAGTQVPGSLVAVQQRGDLWSILKDGVSIADRRPPPGTRVVGPLRSAPTGEPQLLLLEPDQRTLTILGLAGSHTLHRAAAPIADVVLGTARPQLAYATTAGEVVILSIEHEAPLARFLPGAGR